MNLQSIRTKLTLSYLAIALLTALLIYVLIRVTSHTRLEALILEQQITELRDEVAIWYEAEQSWDGFLPYIQALHPPPPPRQKTNNTQSQPPPSIKARHGVITTENLVLASINGYEPGEQLPDVLTANAVAVEVDGQTVAYIIPDKVTGISLAAEEQVFLQRANEVLLATSLAAIGIALLMGIGLARLFNRPIHDLTVASKAMASGDFEQHVPIRSQDELGQLAATFNQMSLDLATANQQRRQMTADIAHDLSTPLQVISGYVEAMQEGSLTPTPERLATIAHEIDHLHHLIADLDILAQTDTHTLSLQMEAVNTHAFLHRVERSFTPLTTAQNITLRIVAPTTLPALYADEERLMQVVGNLVSNALRYTPPNGRITITAAAQSDTVMLHIADSGSGISKEDMPYIFDRFYRADQARTEGGKMGLGLSISKALIEAMGGQISAESSPSGTTFCVSLATR